MSLAAAYSLKEHSIAVRGRVKKKSADGRVDLELWIENAGEVTVPGTATVILPAAS